MRVVVAGGAALLCLAVAWGLRLGWRAVRSSSVTASVGGGRVDGRAVHFAGWALLLAVLGTILAWGWAEVGGSGEPWSGIGGLWAVLYRLRYDAYEGVLCGTPGLIQGSAGLGLLMMVSVPALLLASRRMSTVTALAGSAGLLVLTLLLALLPWHLSAPDHDDFFVLGKLTCVADAGWRNDKPFFTAYDLLFRTSSLWGFSFKDMAESFAVNSWIYVIYLVNLGLIVRRFVVWGHGIIPKSKPFVAICIICFCYFGGLVLSHSIFYELASSTLFLTSFNLIEHIRINTIDRRRAGLLIAWWSLLGLLIHVTSTNQPGLIWLVTFAHGFAAVIWRRSGLVAAAFGGAATMGGVAIFYIANYMAMSGSAGPNWTRYAVAGVVGGVLLAFGVVFRLFVFDGRRWWRERDENAAGVLVLVGYALAGWLLLVLPNQMVIFPPFLSAEPWHLATNFARYSLCLYPFAVVLVLRWLVAGSALGRGWWPEKSSLGEVEVAAGSGEGKGWSRHLAVGALLLALNVSFLTGFYFHGGREADEVEEGAWPLPAPYQVNTRALEGAVELLSGVSAGQRLFTMPLPRDHSDRYLLKVASVGALGEELCGAKSLGADDLLLLSRHSMSVMEEEGRGDLWRGLSGTLRPLGEPGWDVQLVPLRDLSVRGVERWCREYGGWD